MKILLIYMSVHHGNTEKVAEVMANVLDTDLEQMGSLSLESRDPCQITSTCTVFAESEMVSLRAEGKKREDLILGIIRAASSRVVTMGRAIHFRKEVVFTGGVAKNLGMKKAIEEQIGLGVLVPQDPQLTGALGAALMAEVEATSLRHES